MAEPTPAMNAPEGGSGAPQNDDQKRERSTIEFPYLDLEDSIEIAKAVHEVGGASCQWDQVGAHLNVTSTSGSFRMRMQTAKMFGLITYERGTVYLTPLGTRICDPQQEKAARVEAFLAIPLYSAVHDKFKGVNLPPNPGLEGAMGVMGVSSKVRDKARQVFQRSAAQAGFFSFGNTRLVMPSIKASAAAPTETEIEEEKPPEKKKEKKESDRRHPLIEGLLQELPEPQTEWTTEDRKRWLEMASTIFNVIYKDSDDSRGSLKVVVERGSAK
jgi:hypothetical protein